MGSSAPITGYCVHLLHGLHTPTCILLVPLTWHRRQHWHLQIYGTHDVKVFWDRRNAKAVAECWLRVRVHELGKFQMNLLRVELAPTALKALQPLWTVWRKLQLHLVVIWTWMWIVNRILRNEGLPKTPCNFTSIRYLCVDTEPLWLLDILRCCVLLELSQTQRL